MANRIRQMVRPRIMPYAFKIYSDFMDRRNVHKDHNKQMAIYGWVKDTFGESNYDVWTSRREPTRYATMIYFMDDTSAMAFKLQWM